MEVVVDGGEPNEMMGFMMMFGWDYAPLFLAFFSYLVRDI